MYRFLVIKSITDMAWYDSAVSRDGDGIYNALAPFNADDFIQLRIPTYTVGEIVIVNDIGREVVGCCRKPDETECEYETFGDIGSAIRCAATIIT